MAILLVYLLLYWGERREDTMFTITVLIAMAGFLTVPLSLNTSFFATTSTLLRFADECFAVLVWGVVTALGRRNVYGYVAVVAIMKLMDSLGTLLGAVSGHLTNDFVQTDFFMATGFALTMVFLFFAFLWCGFRNFSFNDTIESMTSVAVPVSEPIEQPAEEPASEPVLTVQDVLDRNCEEIGARCGLTEREREIFTMMAHGRNGRYVMEHFVISRNTAKSHIKHIYAKLGVHSHQELIDLAAGVSRDAE